MQTVPKIGTVVRPNHKGEDPITGRTIDWTVYRGMVTSEPFHFGELPSQVCIKWFGAGRFEMPHSYPIRDLTVVRSRKA